MLFMVLYFKCGAKRGFKVFFVSIFVLRLNDMKENRLFEVGLFIHQQQHTWKIQSNEKDEHKAYLCMSYIDIDTEHLRLWKN